MKKCKYCGAMVPDDSMFCGACGAEFEVTERAEPFFDTTSTAGAKFKPDFTESLGIAILAFFAPVLAPILAFVWKDTRPGYATSCIKGALAYLSAYNPIIGFILYFVLKKDRADLASVVLKAAIIGTIVIVAGVVLYYAVVLSTFFKLISATYSETYSAATYIPMLLSWI